MNYPPFRQHPFFPIMNAGSALTGEECYSMFSTPFTFSAESSRDTLSSSLSSSPSPNACYSPAGTLSTSSAESSSDRQPQPSDPDRGGLAPRRRRHGLLAMAHPPLRLPPPARGRALHAARTTVRRAQWCAHLVVVTTLHRLRVRTPRQRKAPLAHRHNRRLLQPPTRRV